MKVSLDDKILASALVDKKSAMELSGLNAKYFKPEIQWLFSAIMHYFKDPYIKSIPTRDMVREYLGEKSENLIADFDRISSIKCNPSEFKWLIQKIQARYNNQVQKEISDKIANIMKSQEASTERVEEINKIIKQTVVDIDTIGHRKLYKEGSLAGSAEERINNYKHIKEHPETARGILTGFTTFDRITNGLHPGEFMIIAGETNSGKSILMHNVAVNAYISKNNIYDQPEAWDDQGKNVLYFSLEMPKESIERRIDSCIAGVYANHIRDGLLSDEDEEKYFKCLEFQSKYKKHFHIVDMPKGATTREIELKYIEVMETLFRPDLVVVDYMGIMSANNSSGSDWFDLGIIAAELHEFSRVYEISTITGSQVNRTKDGAEIYNSGRIARSGMIPNNANIIIQIGCRPDEHLRTDMPVYITKMRDGERGMFTLSKDFGKMKVVDIVEDSFTDDNDDIDV